MRIKLILVTISIFVFSVVCFSQQYTHVYYLDEGFNSVEKAKAVFICKGYNDNGVFKLDCFTENTRVLVLSASFTDSSISLLNGKYHQYYDGKKIQSSGEYQNGYKQGVWQDWNEDEQKTDSAFYEKGTRLRYARYTYFETKKKSKEDLYSYEYNDSLANTMESSFYSDSGILKSQVKFVGDKGLWTHYNTDGTTITDTVFSRIQTEAQFPGGAVAWSRYLEKSLGSFNPAENGAKNGKWQVVVKFIVDKDGTISDVQAETNFGHKMEETVVKMITKGPKWIPANQFGKPIRAYRRQPVTFWVEEQ